MDKKKKKEIKKEEKISEVDLLRAQLARALADYDNLRKRVDRDNEQLSLVANLKLVLRLLPIIDMLDSAQAHLNDSGLAIVIEEFKTALKDEGIVRLEIKVGDIFNEETCEAVETLQGVEDNDKTIAEVTLPGYKYIDGPVIRHAKVRVYKKN